LGACQPVCTLLLVDFPKFGLVICRTKLVKDSCHEQKGVCGSSGRHALQVAVGAKKCVIYTSHFQLTSVAEVEIIALALYPLFSRLFLSFAHPFEGGEVTMMPQGSATVSTVDSSRTFVFHVAVVAASRALPLVFCSNCLLFLFWTLLLRRCWKGLIACSICAC